MRGQVLQNLKAYIFSLDLKLSCLHKFSLSSHWEYDRLCSWVPLSDVIFAVRWCSFILLYKIHMKKTLFILSIVPFLAAPASLAAEHTAANVTELEQCWSNAADGDTILLTGDCLLTDTTALTPKNVTIKGQDGASLVWVSGGGLPVGVTLEGVTATGSGTPLLSGDTINIGAGNTFQNNAGVIDIAAGGVANVTGSNIFDANLSTGDGGAACVGSGATLNLTTNAGDVMTFSNNEDAAGPNDIFANDSATINITTAADSSVELGSGIASLDDTAILNKMGDGTMLLSDAAFWGGTINVQSGTVEQAANSIVDGTAVSLAAGTTWQMGAGSTMNAPLAMTNATLRVVDNAALASTTIDLNGNNTWTFVLDNAALQNAQTNPVLSLSGDPTITAHAGATLTLNLDLRNATSAAAVNKIMLTDLATTPDASKAVLTNAAVTYTDRNGTHATGEHLDDTGMLDIADILANLDATIVWDRPGAAAANALWSSTSALRAFATHSMTQHGQRLHLPTKSTDVWVMGMAHVDTASDVYRYNGGGYALGATTRLGKEWQLGVSFGQMFGTHDSRLTSGNSDDGAQIDQNEIMFGLSTRYVHELSANTSLGWEAMAAYGRTDNDYTAATHSGDWADDNIYIGSRLFWQYRQEDGTCITPFIGIEWQLGSQDGASFTGATPWRTDGADLSVLSIPVGVNIARSFEAGNAKIFTPSIELLYRGDIARSNPELTATDGHESWTVRGYSPARSAFEARGNLHLKVDEQWSVFGSYSLEARSDTTQHRFSAGVQYAF